MSLVSYLSSRFRTDEENVATEALGYILNSSPAATSALTRFLRLINPRLPERLHYRTQASGPKRERPDLEGKTDSGLVGAVIEAKFFAGLTANQPIAYFDRLPADGSGLLLFITPADRIAAIWSEIARLCKLSGIEISDRTEIQGTRSGITSDNRAIAIVSWRATLEALDRELVLAGEPAAANDVAQLQALCNRMDNEAFRPFRDSDLTSQAMPRFIWSLFSIVDAIRAEALRSGCATDKSPGGNLTKSQGRGFDGWYIRVGGADLFIGVDVPTWAKFGQSPVWITFSTADAAGMALARERLVLWKNALPQRYFEDEGLIFIPIWLLSGQTDTAVVEYAVQQLGEIRDRLSGTVGAE
jgi:hypothetical protein